jgi:hypothetical protein
MVAYSFKRMFVPAIRIGLGLDPVDPEPGARRPKRQTIRANRYRHARPGEQLQLYTSMRSRLCELIGKARCTQTPAIAIRFPKPYRKVESVHVSGGETIRGAAALDAFAQSDGFADWQSFREFWAENHPGVLDFGGVMILWEPLP